MPKKDKKAPADPVAAIMEKVGKWREPYAAAGARLHALITQAAPQLEPRLWYGMPAYARDGEVRCFFRLDKYLTFGLTEHSTFHIAAGAPHRLMEAAWFFSELDAATEAAIADILRRHTV